MQAVDLPLHGKVAIVTGAGKGIGKAIALSYAQAGAAVCCAARTETQVRATVSEILAAGGQAIAAVTDVAQEDDVRRMVDATIEAFGGLDILVINAGVNGEKLPVDVGDAATWRATIEVNLIGAYLCAQAAVPHLKARGAGKVITIGSGMGHRGLPGLSSYACSKAGLWMLTRVLAQELAPFRIAVNELVPGPVQTDMTMSDDVQPFLQAPGVDGEWFKTPEDVLPLALFLATQPSRGPTAQSFRLLRRDV